jgi:hypothetical protein
MNVCPTCGSENPAGFRFCGSCGAMLAEAPSAREVRKTVTILFELAGRVDEARTFYEQAVDAFERKGVLPDAEATRQRLEQLA